MKKYIKLFSLVVFLLLFTNCQKNELLYSCDEGLNDWVFDHKEEIKEMNRENWKLLDERVKIPVYRAFNQEQRISFWKEKVKELLTLDWSEEEKQHISLLADFIEKNPNFFALNKKTDEESEKYDIFAYKWVMKAQRDLHWDMKLITAMVANGNLLLDRSGRFERSKTHLNIKRYQEMDNCQCDLDQYIPWCLNGCQKSPCNQLETGCGFMLAYKCDGMCDVI